MMLQISLILIGLLFIFIEFFLPGGIMAILGALALGVGALLLLLSTFSLLFKSSTLIFTVLLIIIVCKLALSIIKNRQRKNYLLETDQAEFVASTLDMALVGHQGEAASDLKPSGHILVNQKRVQAISESDYIAKGKKITIIDGRGAYYIVKET